MNSAALIDIETGPLPLVEVEQFKPEFKAPGNYKDPAKIAEAIKEQEQKWLSDGALSPVTGRVLAIGRMVGDVFSVWDCTDEKQGLADCMNWMGGHLQAGGRIVGFFIKTFDITFLARRCWHHGVHVPLALWEGRFLNSGIIDLAERWSFGSRDPRDRISLDHLSKHLGTGAKNGDGAEFHRLWETDKVKALEYLKNDLVLTKAAYERLYL